MFSWLTDQVGAAAAGATATEVTLSTANYGAALTAADVTNFLVPQYLQSVPDKDGWKNAYQFWMNTANVLAPTVLAIRSYGRDNTSVGDTLTVAGFDPTDYNQDIVWADGFFVRWPQKTN
jgi:hypothetical protein